MLNYMQISYKNYNTLLDMQISCKNHTTPCSHFQVYFDCLLWCTTAHLLLACLGSIPLWCVAEVQSSCSLVCFSSSSWFFTPYLEVFPTSRKKFWKFVLAFLIMSIGDSLTHQIYPSPDIVFKLESLKSCDFLY